MNWRSMPVDAPCLICGAAGMRVFPDFAALPRITSDSRPWPAGGALVQCRDCGAVQKPTGDTWRTEISEIYADYAVYHQSGGAEQPVFAPDGGAGAPRSEVLLRRLFDAQELAPEGRMVDVGCGNGGLLRSFAKIAPGWRLNGADQNARHRDEILGVAGVEGFFAGRPSEFPGTFDLVTLVHCLEHVPDPCAFLADIAAKLNPGGAIFVEVPDLTQNPFDLLIADHCTHFTRTTLSRLAGRAGLAVAGLANDWVGKELSAVLRADGDVGLDPDGRTDGTSVDGALRWLERAMAKAGDYANSDRTFGIFGTSIAGVWLFSASRGAAKFFVDEDPVRAGRDFMGRPVLHPVDVPDDAVVILAAPDDAARNLNARLEVGPGTYVAIGNA